MRREFAILPAALIAAAAYGCSLNPQPLPPDTVCRGTVCADAGSGVTIANPGVGDAARGDLGEDSGEKGGGAGDDAGTVGAEPDATSTPPMHGDDGGAAAPDATNGADGGGPTTPPDGAIPDGGTSDAARVDGAIDSSLDSAIAPDAGTDGAL